jgi:hypothetical protein
MSDRERRVLESIEHELRRTDPRLVRQFARLGKRRITGPSMLLTLGLVVMVLGSAIVSVPVALLGIAIAAVAVVTAYYRPLGFRFSGG